MSGTNINSRYDDALSHLEAVLDRQVSMEPLTALTEAVGDRTKLQFELGKIAIGFDSSVFMRLATHKRSADILDYLPRHNAPLILPGQAIQEFWNNQMSVIATVSKSLQQKFEQFAGEARKLDSRFNEYEDQMIVLLASFESEFGYLYSEKTRDSVTKMLSILESHAHCSFVPRMRFQPLAELRKITKTPPGFMDEGFGDFFIWADFLYGLLTTDDATAQKPFEKVVLVTNDIKRDWSRHGIPHPILPAEVRTLFSKPFDLWDLDTLRTIQGGDKPDLP